MAGRFLLTLDTEIAWGTFYWKGFVYYKKHFDNYRTLVRRFIGLLDKYEISATWAFVGHLMLDHCDGLHADVLRPRYSWFNYEDWHKYDPGSDISKDPHWYGSDILEWVRSMQTPQEIATHTFSHVHMADIECTAEIARSQVESCILLGQKHGLVIESLVFPRDEIAHLDQFAELGITCYRGAEEVWCSATGGLLRRICGVLDQFCAITPPVYKIEELHIHHGLLNIPGSNFLYSYDRYHRWIPTFSRIVKIKKGINKAIDENAIYHLVFHPFHLGSSDRMFDVFDRVLAYVADKRAQGLLEVNTMKEVCTDFWQAFHESSTRSGRANRKTKQQ